ncbi:MAG TPA: ribulose-phosphate 3-epimerase, partial [Atribacterota bacterium]|nr:ribulose-phosphate 3-epimerase [Atribacterota bacterium]
MTVNPGFGGQQFIPAMIEKIGHAKRIIGKNEKSIEIQVDGGINMNNILTVNRAGANILVVGSEIFESKNPENMIQKIQKKLQIFK